MSPRLHGYSETRKFDVFDAMFDGFDERFRANLTGVSLHLFGNINVGSRDLTNLQVGGQLAYDETSYIQNWYARTNVPERQSWKNFAHATICELVVGTVPQLTAPLSNLLCRVQDQPLPLSVDDPESADKRVTAMAEDMLRAYSVARGIDDRGMTLADIDSNKRDGWRAAAAVAMRKIGNQIMIIVPVRQNFTIRLTTSRETVDALVLDAKNYSGVLPKPRAWIHVQGFSRRDVC
jgi:hypothetical protein